MQSPDVSSDDIMIDLHHLYEEKNEAASQSWLNWTTGRLRAAGNSFVNQTGQSVVNAIKKPHLSIPAFVSAMPTAFYAMLNPSHKTALEASKNWPVWWGKMSWFNKTRTILNGVASLDVNYKLALDYTPKAVQKFAEDLKTFKANPIGKSIVMGGATSAAFASAFLGYEAWEFLPSLSAAVVGGAAGTCTLGIYLVTRYVAIKTTITRTQSIFDADKKIQKKLINDLNHLKPIFREELDETLEGQTLHDRDTILKLIQDFNQFIVNHPGCIQKKSTLETAGQVFDAVFALLITPAVFTLFNQKFLDGLQTFETMITGTEKIAGLPNWSKGLMGTIPGAISGMLYYNSALDVREAFLKNFRRNATGTLIVGTLIIFLENICASESNQSIAEAIANDPANHFSWIIPTINSSYGQIYPILNAAGAFAVNAKSHLRYAYGDINKDRPKVDDLVKWLESNQLAKEECRSLRQHSLFSSSPHSSSAPQRHELPEHLDSPGLSRV